LLEVSRSQMTAHSLIQVLGKCILFLYWNKCTSRFTAHLYRSQVSNISHNYLIFFVLSSIRKARYNGSHSRRWCNLACIDHDEKFHYHVVYFSTTTLYDEYILSANRLTNLYTTAKQTPHLLWSIAWVQWMQTALWLMEEIPHICCWKWNIIHNTKVLALLSS